MLGVGDGRLHLEDLFEPVHGGAPALQQREHPAEGRHGPRQHVQVKDERNQVGDAALLAHDEPAAVPQHHKHGEAVQRHHHGVDQAAAAGEVEAAHLVLVVHPGEAGGLGLRLHVRLDHVHAAQVLLHVGAHARHLPLHPQRRPPDAPAELLEHERQERQARAHRKRQLPVHGEHEHRRVDQVEWRVHQVEEAGAQQHAHGVDVVDCPGHEVAGLLGLVIAQGELLQVGEEVVPQVVLDVPARVEDDGAGDPAQQPAARRGQGDPQHVAAQFRVGIAALDDVDGPTHPPRHHHEQAGGADQAHPAYQVTAPVAPQIVDQPSDAGHVERSGPPENSGRCTSCGRCAAAKALHSM